MVALPAALMSDQSLMGAGVVVLCLWGLACHRWLLDETRKGQWLVRSFGPSAARGIVVALLASGAVGGVLLIADIIRPVRW